MGDAVGQAFTVAPRSYRGSLAEALSQDLSSLWGRGIFYAAVNAVARLSGAARASMHCQGTEPVYCAKKLARLVVERVGRGGRVLHIGYHPTHVRELHGVLGPGLLVTDLRSDTVWRRVNGVLVYDGMLNRNYIAEADLVLVTGSAIVNGSIWSIIADAVLLGREVIVYGVSALGALSLISRRVGISIGLFCPYAK